MTDPIIVSPKKLFSLLDDITDGIYIAETDGDNLIFEVKSREYGKNTHNLYEYYVQTIIPGKIIFQGKRSGIKYRYYYGDSQSIINLIGTIKKTESILLSIYVDGSSVYKYVDPLFSGFEYRNEEISIEIRDQMTYKRRMKVYLSQVISVKYPKLGEVPEDV